LHSDTHAKTKVKDSHHLISGSAILYIWFGPVCFIDINRMNYPVHSKVTSPHSVICMDYTGISHLGKRASLIWQCYFNYVISDF